MLSLERIERAERLRPKAGDDAQCEPAPPAALPYARYLDDPVGFGGEVLGVRNIWSRQREVLQKVARHKKVAVRSGHKVSKSKSAAMLAAWWVSTRPRGKVVLTSSSFENVDLTLWPELRQLHRESTQPLGGYLLGTPRGGWRFDDGRSVFGVSTNKPERAAGKSGDEMLYIADEASGIEEAIFDAIEGNLAGGASIVLFGNPTQPSGTFHDAFDRPDVWESIHISSEESPNVVEGRIVIPGLATREWVEEKRRLWGENSPRYQIRVKGDFADMAENVVIGLALIAAAKDRYECTNGDGVLNLGVDVARFGDDESVIQPRRGYLAMPAIVLQSMDTVFVAGKVLQVARDLRRPGERVRIKVDVIGVGGGVADILRTHKDVEVVDVNVSEASDDPEDFANLRSQLWFGLADWLADGGAIPDDRELQADLRAPKYGFDARGRRRVEPKEEMKKRLKRSPDRGDALTLSVYGAGPEPIRPPTSIASRSASTSRWARMPGRGFG